MATSSIPTTTPSAEIRAANRHRFEFELEFVQSLANPHYLQSLAQQNILSQPSFVLYLDYLQYWTGPEYARFVVYPHALHHLSLLQNPGFREALKNTATAQWLSEKQFDHWRTWRAGPVPTVSLEDAITGAKATIHQDGRAPATVVTEPTPLFGIAPMAPTPHPFSS
ncbi:hypothetical protein BS47DRAFT_1486428 [Hydnum rufescens UP504]|uniref:Mediator of RNA polymerase II transcription subunit 31 n=1 Tax=Hydnum rufescens UP504 TaxID=1448309 RepID=A0A9P6DV05_9AGAM|nr:hypothetical protein BS47DRAFT_1486428 [Hydnum rufescens UP504]